MPSLRNLFKGSSDGNKLTKRRAPDTSESASQHFGPPGYSPEHAPPHAPPSFASRAPSIAPSVATQLPTYDSIIPPGSRGRGVQWQNYGNPPPLPAIRQAPPPVPLTPAQVEAFARAKRRLALVPKETWDMVGDLLDPVSAASLKLSCRTIHDSMSSHHFKQLNAPHNKHHKIEFLYAGATPSLVPVGSPPSPTTADDANQGDNGPADNLVLSSVVKNAEFDRTLPYHLFCFNCCTYHARLRPGAETLSPSWIATPVFTCPTLKSLPTPRLAVTPSRKLPFTLPQLLARATRLDSPAHGIHTTALSKTWVDLADGFDASPDVENEGSAFTSYDGADGGPIGWRHRTQLRTHHGHVLLRVSSTHVLPQRVLSTSEINRLLTTRSNYAPYFSTCQHWQTAGPVGPLISLAKCAIGHAQAPHLADHKNDGKNVDRRGKPKRSVIPSGSAAGAPSLTGLGSKVTSQCAECRPLRRCEDCGTEYLIQLKVQQDRARRKSSASSAGGPGGSGGAAAPSTPAPLPKFRPYLSVTRYSDLGPCVRPDELQWRSVAGDDGEIPNEVRVPQCLESPRHIKSVRAAFEADESVGGAASGTAIALGRRIEWVKEHVEEVERERERERMLAERRAKPQTA